MNKHIPHAPWGEKYADALKVAYTLQDIFPGYTPTKDIFYFCFDGWVNYCDWTVGYSG